MLSSHPVTLGKSRNPLHVSLKQQLTTKKSDAFAEFISSCIKCHV